MQSGTRARELREKQQNRLRNDGADLLTSCSLISSEADYRSAWESLCRHQSSLHAKRGSIGCFTSRCNGCKWNKNRHHGYRLWVWRDLRWVMTVYSPPFQEIIGRTVQEQTRSELCQKRGWPTEWNLSDNGPVTCSVGMLFPPFRSQAGIYEKSVEPSVTVRDPSASVNKEAEVLAYKVYVRPLHSASIFNRVQGPSRIKWCVSDTSGYEPTLMTSLAAKQSFALKNVQEKN